MSKINYQNYLDNSPCMEETAKAIALFRVQTKAAITIRTTLAGLAHVHHNSIRHPPRLVAMSHFLVFTLSEVTDPLTNKSLEVTTHIHCKFMRSPIECSRHTCQSGATGAFSHLLHHDSIVTHLLRHNTLRAQVEFSANACGAWKHGCPMYGRLRTTMRLQREEMDCLYGYKSRHFRTCMNNSLPSIKQVTFVLPIGLSFSTLSTSVTTDSPQTFVIK